MNNKIISEELFVARYGSFHLQRSNKSIVNKYRNAVLRYGMDAVVGGGAAAPNFVKIYVCALNGTVEVFEVPVGTQRRAFWRQISERFCVNEIHEVISSTGEGGFPGEGGITEEHNNEIVQVLFPSSHYKHGVYLGGCLTYHQLISVQEFPTSEEESPTLMITYYQAPTQHHDSIIKTDFVYIHNNVGVDESENLFHLVASRELFQGIDLDMNYITDKLHVPDINVSKDGKCIAWVTKKTLYTMRIESVNDITHSIIDAIPLPSQKSFVMTGVALLDNQFALVNVSRPKNIDLYIYDLLLRKKVLSRTIKNEIDVLGLNSYKVADNLTYDSVSNGYAYGKLFVTMETIRNAVNPRKVSDIPFKLLVDKQRLMEPLKSHPEIMKVKTFDAEKTLEKGKVIFHESLIVDLAECTQHNRKVNRIPMNVISSELSTRMNDVYIYSTVEADATDTEYVIRCRCGLTNQTLVQERGLFIAFYNKKDLCILLPEVESEEERTYRSLRIIFSEREPNETDNQVIVEGTEATLTVRPHLLRTDLEG